MLRFLGSQKCPHSAPDSALIEACLDNQSGAWDSLLDRYKALIFSIPLRMGMTEEEAADVFQEVCVALLTHLGELRDHARLAGWIASTTKRESWRQQHRRGAVVSADLTEADGWQMPLPGAAESATSPEDELIAVEEKHLVHVALMHLPERCRQMFGLLYVEDNPCSYVEAAQRLGIPLNSLGPTRGRCLARMKKLLKEMGF